MPKAGINRDILSIHIQSHQQFRRGDLPHTENHRLMIVTNPAIALIEDQLSYTEHQEYVQGKSEVQDIFLKSRLGHGLLQ